MDTRRQFIRKSIRWLSFSGLWLGPVLSGFSRVWAGTKRYILPKGTRREELINRNPALVDARNLEITRLKDFRTMGQTDFQVNLKDWRLEVAGRVKRPTGLTYAQVVAQPALERNVLLICPGVFANHGRWKGLSIRPLLEAAEMEDGVTHVTIAGPKGDDENKARFPIKDVLSDKVFLSYEVNGRVLPVRHGYPLRAVAEDYYGSDWIKYVYRITAEIEKKT